MRDQRKTSTRIAIGYKTPDNERLTGTADPPPLGLKKRPEDSAGGGRGIGLPDDDLELEKDEPLNRNKLYKCISKSCCDAGLDGGGPHAARHFFATQLLLGGIPIIKVSALLGHSTVSTTQRHYSHILSPDLSDVTSVLKAI